MNPQGTEVIVEYDRISFEVWDIAQNRSVMNYNGQEYNDIDAGFSPGGKWIYMFTKDSYHIKNNRISFWDAKSHGALIT